MTSVGTVKKYSPISSTTPSSTTNYGPFNRGYESMADYLSSPFLQNPLTHRRGKAEVAYASGTYNNTTTNTRVVCDRVSMVNNVLLRIVRPFEYAALLPNKQNSTYLAQLAQSNANPNSPDIDLPVSIVELRDLPSMLQHLGNLELTADKIRRHGSGHSSPTVTQATAKGYVMAKFGWAPLISDLLTLCDFADKVASREAYLRAMKSKKGKRIQRKLTKESGAFHSILTAFPSDVSNATNNALILHEWKREYWYSARAKLTEDIPSRELKTRAIRALTGTQNLSVESLWNLIPWTWLIDWFTSTGTLLSAYRGGMPWNLLDLNVMSRTDVKSTCSFSGLRPGITLDLPNPTGNAVEHYRSQPVAWPTIVMRTPYLSLSQLGILLSLFTLKMSRNGGVIPIPIR